MIIIRNNSLCPVSFHRRLERYIRCQALDGIIVLPEYCELLHADPGDNHVMVITREEQLPDNISGSPDQADPV